MASKWSKMLLLLGDIHFGSWNLHLSALFYTKSRYCSAMLDLIFVTTVPVELLSREWCSGLSCGSSSGVITRVNDKWSFLLQTFHFQCKYTIEPSLEKPATKSCGGLSMTKDNQDDVDKVENALKYLKPGFQNKQCNKTSHLMVKIHFLTSRWVGSGLSKAARMDRNIIWMLNGLCMFSIVGGSENSKLFSLVLISYLILLFSSTIFLASLNIQCTIYIDRFHAS